ncbi:cytochrome c oxidase cbb3-type subunit 4 [Rhizobium azooxidifex]|uniref:Cytochrome c oxidase cbb3-type subunit 4 n=1 Tax=Mycoplana azooxidifex TaxID=1636188 RepID=A0A7W6GGR9_9HYPH|nr:cbb3-type cytochrome c oxidase subunit 3 [Mycoplana azooxidifex]MBB3975196.1 cytochrome c oxidase cbb3-type subunit 4 [Mycoplana azooxidifex]
MSFDHDTIVGFSKSFGLLYLVAMSIGVVIYAFWPANKKQFDRAAESVVSDEEDRPWL